MNSRSRLKYLYLIMAAEGVGVLIALLSSHNDPTNVWLFGISRTRLILSAGVLIVTAISAFLYFGALRQAPWEARFHTAILNFIRKERNYRIVLVLLGILLFFGYYLYFLSGQVGDNLVRVQLERMRPLLVWDILFAGQMLFMLPSLKLGEDRQAHRLPANLLKSAVWFAALLSVLVLLSAVTKLGLEPDKVGWDNPGTPLLFVQLVLVVVVGVLLKFLVSHFVLRLRLNVRWHAKDIFLAMIIWLAAMAVWLPAPVTPTYFSPHPRAPNFEYYPYSDAGLHDIAAQNLILGEGYSPLAEKPLYSLFLAATHLLVGQEYQAVINVQTMILAFFPVLIYLLLTRMYNRTAGVIAAGALIVREWNNIALSPQIRVSHSKLIMTDLPAAFLIAISVCVLFWWLSKRGKLPHGAIIAGGSLGLALLIRSQAIIFIPVVLLVMLFMYLPDWKKWLIHGGAFILAVVVVISPWMVRNYQQTGVFGYAQPNQALYIAKQYSLTPEEADPGFPEEATQEEYTTLGFSKMMAFSRDYPQVVANFIASHFMRNEISAILIFPMSISDVAIDNSGPRFFDVDPFVWQDCCSLQASIDRAPFWGDWQGELSGENAAMLVVNLTIIALGIAGAWRRWGILGILPLALHFAYSFSVAIARVSGWRLILPVDWIVIVYYCIGIAIFLGWLSAFLSGRQADSGELAHDRSQDRISAGSGRLLSLKAALWLLLFAGAGAIVPLAEAVFPSYFEQITNIEQVYKMEEFSELFDLFPTLDSFLLEDGAVAVIGRALYPRYYRAGQFEPGGKWPGNVEYPVSRLAFYLAGPSYSQVVFPLADVPVYFPNAVDVALIGCQVEGYIQAYAVVVAGPEGRFVYLDEYLNELKCSPHVFE